MKELVSCPCAGAPPGITDAQSTMEVMVDMRRGKLLKSLRKVWLRPLRHSCM